MPDGYSLSLDQFKGLNQTGDAGLRDQVNNHYLRIFGVSLAIGALGSRCAKWNVWPLTASGTDLMRQGFAQKHSAVFGADPRQISKHHAHGDHPGRPPIKVISRATSRCPTTTTTNCPQTSEALGGEK